MKIRSLIILAVALGIGCGPSHPSAAVARDFMEAYYVKADLKASASLADGLALEKVRTSEKLRADLAADAASPPEAKGRKIAFKLVESKIEGSSATYLYRIKIQPKGTELIRKKTLVRVRQSAGGGWKVTQFTDLEDT